MEVATETTNEEIGRSIASQGRSFHEAVVSAKMEVGYLIMRRSIDFFH